MSDLGWYVVGVVIVGVLASFMTASDVWLLGIERPHLRAKTALLAVRWAFFCSVLVYAWLIDSRRVPYQEPAIWAFLGVGIVLTGVTHLLGRGRDRS